MALLKAFVCQVILLGLYKLFLEQVIEEHLVPDELTRNCLVGFVCLLCFGIQLYTDKAGDEDNSEADENPKAKSKSRRETNAKSQSDKQVGDSRGSNGISPFEAEKITEVGHSDIFVQCTHYNHNPISNVKAYGMVESEGPDSAAQTSCDQKRTNIPVVSGFTETNACEESDEDGIEIDKFVASESAEDEIEQLISVTAEEVEAIKSKEDGTETVVESESLTINGNDFLSDQDTNMTTTTIGQESKKENICSTAEESLNINNVSNIIDEVESKKSVNAEGKIVKRQDVPLFSEPDEHTKGNTSVSPSYAREMISSSSPTTKTINNVEATNNSNEEISLVKTAVSSQLKKLTVSTRQNGTPVGEICFTPVTIDISFIYACH